MPREKACRTCPAACPLLTAMSVIDSSVLPARLAALPIAARSAASRAASAVSAGEICGPINILVKTPSVILRSVSPRRKPQESPMAVDVAQLLAFAVKNNASDLHLSAGVPPMIRVDGDMKRINMPALTHKEVHGMVYDIMNDKQRKAYEEFFETDFSFEIPKLARFRVNAFNQNRGAGAVFRNIPSNILSLDELGSPKIFRDLCMLPRGLVLVTGPTGSGKSTTLAGMIDYCNDNRPDHIITIEDPIEFVHECK